MIDLISRRAAIRWVKTECNPYGKPTLDFESSKKVIEHLAQMPSAQQWIPVAERLPEENQVCIVTDETREGTYEYRFCKQTYDEEQGWTYLRHRIIAWMPLPEPYEGEQ